jgi:hypothetical protein
MNIGHVMTRTRSSSLPNPALLDSAAAALRALGIEAEGEGLEQSNAEHRADAELSIRFGTKSVRYLVECKPSLHLAGIGPIAHRFSSTPGKRLLVTEYVAPRVAERLRELNVEFVDLAGNAYLRNPHMLIWVTGRKPEAPPLDTRASRAFQPGGLKLIFAVLCMPELIDAPYRYVASAAGVALGTVGWVMQDLKNERYLLELGQHGRKFANRSKLLEQWVEGYARQLRPKLLIGRFRHLGSEPLERQELPEGALWGGETAAAKLTRYLRPEISTLYLPAAQGPNAELMKKLRLVRDENGNIELRKIFWHFHLPDTRGTVPPLLVYADLLATDDGRNIETARLIYDDHLARFVEQG